MCCYFFLFNIFVYIGNKNLEKDHTTLTCTFTWHLIFYSVKLGCCWFHCCLCAFLIYSGLSIVFMAPGLVWQWIEVSEIELRYLLQTFHFRKSYTDCKDLCPSFTHDQQMSKFLCCNKVSIALVRNNVPGLNFWETYVM